MRTRTLFVAFSLGLLIVVGSWFAGALDPLSLSPRFWAGMAMVATFVAAGALAGLLFRFFPPYDVE